MDKLTKQLRDDATKIDARISDDFERRLAASLESAAADKTPVKQPGRPALFWWASSITGAAAALLIVAIMNIDGGVEAPAPQAGATSPVVVSEFPGIDLKTESAMLTRPLEEELENLKTDLKKAEKKVREDIGL